MKISRLQKFILVGIYGRRAKFKRSQFHSFYKRDKKSPKKIDQQAIITRSIERLIDNGLLIGYGRRTQEKWFFDEVKLTIKGKKQAKSLFGQQQTLPLKLKKIKK